MSSTEKVHVLWLELRICGNCNLRCDNCVTLSPFQEWGIPLDELIRTMELASSRLMTTALNICGGEPLLHPDIVSIVSRACELFPSCPVSIMTNGIALRSSPHTPALLELCKRYPHLRFTVSQHVPIQDTLDWLQGNNVPHVMSQTLFHKVPTTLVRSEPAKAWMSEFGGTETCWQRNCYTIFDGRLHRCGLHVGRLTLARYGKKDCSSISQEWKSAIEQWNGIDLATVTNDEIEAYIAEEPRGECSLCYEDMPRDQEQRQLANEELKRIMDSMSEPSVTPEVQHTEFFAEMPTGAEIAVTYGCNLNCRHCRHYAPLFSRAGIPPVPVEDIEKTCKDWSTRFPNWERVAIMGEPLAHPDVERVIEVFSDYWSNVPVKLFFTNGILLSKMPRSFLVTLRACGFVCIISLQYEGLRKQLEAGIKRLQEFCIPYSVNDYTGQNAGLYWIKAFKNELPSGGLELFDSDPKVAASACNTKYRCSAIVDNELYHCAVLPRLIKAQKLGLLNDNRLLTYKPATPDMSMEEIGQWWRSTEWQTVCSICPDTLQPISTDEKKQLVV